MTFYEDVLAHSRTRETPEEVFDYYKDKYPNSHVVHTKKGDKTVYDWQGKLADDMSRFLGIKRDSVMRRFQGARAGKISENQEAEYALLGEMLPPQPPSEGYHIHGTVWVKYSEECVERQVDEYITGDEAKALAERAGYEMFQGLLNYYQTGDMGGKGPSECDEPHISVDAIN